MNIKDQELGKDGKGWEEEGRKKKKNLPPQSCVCPPPFAQALGKLLAVVAKARIGGRAREPTNPVRSGPCLIQKKARTRLCARSLTIFLAPLSFFVGDPRVHNRAGY